MKKYLAISFGTFLLLFSHVGFADTSSAYEEEHGFVQKQNASIDVQENISSTEEMLPQVQENALLPDNSDPYETYNRFMFGVNETLDRNIMTPVARGYRTVAPKPVKFVVRNFFDNLRDVVSLGSNILRLDLEKASIDLMRVSFNTTFGLGGLLNWADAAQMPNNKNTLGDTFATWGWKNSHYFIFPLSGPSTVRDTMGSLVASAYAPEHFIFDNNRYYYAGQLLRAVDTRERYLDLTDSVDQAALDKYVYVRDMYMRFRNMQVGNEQPYSEEDQSLDIDDLIDPSDEFSDDAKQNEAFGAVVANE